MRKDAKEGGLLSLEASICLTLFIFLMLFMYSFFVIFEARNMMAHACLASAKSLSLDVYETQAVTGSRDLAGWISSLIRKPLNNDSPFVSTNRWFTLDDVSTTWNENIYASQGDEEDEDYQDHYGNTAYVSQEFASVLRTRFCAYITGTSDEDTADEYLKRYHVVDGFSGIDFSKSKIVGGDLYLVVRYQLEYEFDIFHFLDLSFEQSVCSKLWK